MQKVSIIIPFKNEEENLQPLYERIEEVMATLKGNYTYECIWVCDGSEDDSLRTIKTYAGGEDNHQIINLGTNMGKAHALMTGFKKATGDIIIQMDADLQDDPWMIPAFLAKLEKGYDFVNGWKKDRKDPWHKTLPSKLFNALNEVVGRTHMHDNNCGFKAYKAEVAKKLLIYGNLHRYIPAYVKAMDYKCCEIPVNHQARIHGKSHYGIERLWHGFRDLIATYFIINHIRNMKKWGLV